MSDTDQDYFLPTEWHGKCVTLTNYSSGTALDVPGGSRNNGTPVHGWEVNRSEAQQWVISKVNVDDIWSPWTLQNVASTTYLYNRDGLSEPNVDMWCWSPDYMSNGIADWFLITQERDQTDPDTNEPIIMLQNAASSMYVDLWGGQSANGTRIAGFHRDGLNYNQMWRLRLVR
ncbi:hypothetical protein J1614_000298 [Plenodomus biglobosus]|nr:hypothetical protein J1614_000298 [Plenodomus biglobosus]